MEGTRKSWVKENVDRVANKSEEKGLLQSNTYWIYSLPGIGKTFDLCEPPRSGAGLFLPAG